jgi:hypothetical protein
MKEGRKEMGKGREGEKEERRDFQPLIPTKTSTSGS